MFGPSCMLLTPRPPSLPTLSSSHSIQTPSSSPAQIMMMRTLKLVVATHLLLRSVCHGTPTGAVSVEKSVLRLHCRSAQCVHDA